MADVKGLKVLVVDDEPDSVSYATSALREMGLQVISASDGVEGLDKVCSEMPDLVILDIQMPEKDGFSVLVDMKEDPQLRTIPVVMLTAVGERTGIHVSAAQVGEYLGEEPDAYVEKPVDPQVLQQTVRRILSARADAE